MPGVRTRTAPRTAAVATLWGAAAAATAVLSWSSTEAYLRRDPRPERKALPVRAMPAVEERAAPAAGVTGTTALPALPSFARFGPVEQAPSPARPFSTAGVAAADRARAAACLTAAVYYEAASEGDAGQRAVAQVVLNRVRHPAFPATVCGVVYQGAERRGCQFSFACDGAEARVPSRAGWARAAGIAAAALAGGVYPPVGLATHYHTFKVTPGWNRGLVMTGAVGAHLFHRWRGWWGTAAAFERRYVGGEPAARPGPAVVAEPEPVARVMPSAAPVEVAAAVPPAPPAEDRLPPASEVLERWKDSGTPLR